MMFDVIDEVAGGRWFKEPSPFRCVVQKHHQKLCIITGPNTSGKSLLRKVIHNNYHDRKIEYIHLSQQGRCNAGMERLFIYGTETDESTGYNSVKMLMKAIQTGQSREKPFVIMFDEPEIGCSDETQNAIGRKIVQAIPTMKNIEAVYVVTHSKELVRGALYSSCMDVACDPPTHWRLSEDGLRLTEWLDRKIVPCDLQALLDEGKEKWHAVHAMLGRL